MNKTEQQQADKVLDTIASLKQKKANPEGAPEGVDLVAIVKKLSRNRERKQRAAKGS